jgi:hypothetical protein
MITHPGRAVMKRLSLFSLTFAFLLPSCAPKHPEDMRTIEAMRGEIDSLLIDQGTMAFRSWTLGTPSNQDSLYRAHAALFAPERFTCVRRAEGEESDSLQRLRLFYLRRHLSFEILSRSTAPATDRAQTYASAALVRTGSDSLPYPELETRLASEGDQGKREALYVGADGIVDSVGSLMKGVFAAYPSVATNLGYGSYTAMIEELRSISLPLTCAMAESLLSRTDSLYAALLPDQLRENAGLEPSLFRRYDTGRLFRAARFDRFFPPPGLLPSVRATYRKLGFDPALQPGLALDTAARALKNPRAACFPIDVPGDVRLSIKPVGGMDDYAALYHEMGHAQHYANTTERALEFSSLGEATLGETYAFLSEYILCNPAWMRQNLTMPVPLLKAYGRTCAFQRLYFVRRYAAKVLFERALFEGRGDAGELYAQLQARALRFRVHPSDARRAFVDTDPHFYSAVYLRAWMLQAQLEQYLISSFGANWFENPGAGTFLRELWEQGDRLNVEGLLQRIGADSLRIGPWLRTIDDLVLFSSQ